jgi:hypothetical protein
VLPYLFPAPTTTKRRKNSNTPKLTTHPEKSSGQDLGLIVMSI